MARSSVFRGRKLALTYAPPLSICPASFNHHSAGSSLERRSPLTDPSGNFQRIAPDVRLGRDVKVFAFVNLYGCTVGDESKIGTFVEIQKNAHVGARCKISSHTFICEGVTIEDDCFIGHHVCFINDKHPQAVNPSGDLQTEADWKVI